MTSIIDNLPQLLKEKKLDKRDLELLRKLVKEFQSGGTPAVKTWIKLNVKQISEAEL